MQKTNTQMHAHAHSKTQIFLQTHHVAKRKSGLRPDSKNVKERATSAQAAYRSGREFERLSRLFGRKMFDSGSLR